MLIYYGALKVANGDDALGFLDDVIDNVKKRYNTEHPLYARALLNKVDFHLQNNRFDLALPLLEEVKVAQLAAVGAKHKDYLNTLVKQATAQWYKQDFSAAKQNFNLAIAGYLHQVNTFFNTLSEPEKSDFWRLLKPAIDQYMAFVAANAANDPSLIREAFNLQIRTKGLLINATTKTRNIILSGNDTTLTRIYREYLNTNKQLATYYSVSLEELKEDNIDLTALEERANALEKEMVNKTTLIESLTQTKLSEVASWLEDGEAAIEMVRIPVNYGYEKGQVRYAAFIITNQNKPEMVVIDNGTELEGRSLKYYKNAIQHKLKDDVSYVQFWKPIAHRLEGVSQVYISLDGVYNSLNINTLQSVEGEFVVDNFDVLTVPNTKYIEHVKHANNSLEAGQTASLFGYPNFGDAEIVTPLPGTREEVIEIDSLLNSNALTTTVFLEDQASEQNFMEVNKPAILHVATHGYFLPDVDLGKRQVMGASVSKAKDNPLLHSGLLLSGAAGIYNDQPTLNGANNGILNAFEIMNLDLNGTDMVIMSACETGRGEIVNGEGVYGLNRAFQVAGADKIIMSLWKVDDKATKDLMTSFYTHLLNTKDSQQAFLAAQREMKARYTYTYYWGAFVMLN